MTKFGVACPFCSILQLLNTAVYLAVCSFPATLLLLSLALEPGWAATLTITDQAVIETDDWWQELHSPFSNTVELVGGRARDGTIQARASIMTLDHSSPKGALARLEREAQLAGIAKVLRISGRPALQATDKVELERRVQDL